VRSARDRTGVPPDVQNGNGAAGAELTDVAAPPWAPGRGRASEGGAGEGGAGGGGAGGGGAGEGGAGEGSAGEGSAGERRAGREAAGTGRRGPRRRLLAVGLALVILAVAGWALLGPTVLVVRHVRVTGTDAQVPAAAVRAAAGIALGTPLARLDAAAAARRVERLPAVLSARVSRSFPDTVVIAVRPRVPALAVPAAAGYALLDAAGVTVSSATAVPAGVVLLTAPPPVLRGSPAVRAAALVVERLPAQLRALVRSVSATGTTVTLLLAGGITVVWGGPEQAAQKAAELDELLGTHARYYDVSDPATAVTGR
jgi:cell division protein FtsQ